MSTHKLVNISLSELETFLTSCGCKHVGIRGGHSKWEKEGLTRPIIYQTHKDPVPVHIVRGILRDLGMTPQDYFEQMSKKK